MAPMRTPGEPHGHILAVPNGRAGVECELLRGSLIQLPRDRGPTALRQMSAAEEVIAQPRCFVSIVPRKGTRLGIAGYHTRQIVVRNTCEDAAAGGKVLEVRGIRIAFVCTSIRPPHTAGSLDHRSLDLKSWSQIGKAQVAGNSPREQQCPMLERVIKAHTRCRRLSRRWVSDSLRKLYQLRLERSKL
jgi:hypothetical protein